MIDLLMHTNEEQPSSIAAKITEYKVFCLQAADHEDSFNDFRRHPCIINMHQHVKQDIALEYYKIICDRYPWILDHIETYRENDSIGNPVLGRFPGIGSFAMTTIRYLKMMGDLFYLFGEQALTEMDYAEIGPGYGGLTNLISMTLNARSYTLVDLPEVTPLVNRFLETAGVNRAKCFSPDRLTNNSNFDLIVSSYAFSECARFSQEEYIDKILSRSTRGYLVCNPRHSRENWKMDSISIPELVDILSLHHCHVLQLPEEPLTYPENTVIAWGTTRKQWGKQD